MTNLKLAAEELVPISTGLISSQSIAGEKGCFKTLRHQRFQRQAAYKSPFHAVVLPSGPRTVAYTGEKWTIFSVSELPFPAPSDVSLASPFLSSDREEKFGEIASQ